MAMELDNNQTGVISVLDNIDIGQINTMMNSIVKFQSLVQRALKQGHDYDTIPGTQKPTLLKPGAEKLLMLMGLTSEYGIVEKIEDYNKGVFAYTIRCTLSKGGQKIAEGLGSCNSKEDKYRWRWVKENDIPVEFDRDTLKSRTTRYGATQYRIENDEIYSQANTILKMAKKRAQIDATLTVSALSEIFTQDIEDMKGFIQSEEVENMKSDEVTNIKITFGKHKGKTLGEVAKEDISYIEWLSKNARDDVLKKAAGMVVSGKDKPKTSGRRDVYIEGTQAEKATKEDSGTINKEQAAELFEAADGDEDVVREVLDIFAYENSTDVEVDKLEDVKKVIKQTFKAKIDATPLPFGEEE